MQPSPSHGTRDTAAHAPLEPWVQAERVVRISRVVQDLGRAEAFYRSVLGFRTLSSEPVAPTVLEAFGVGRTEANEVVMRLGEDEISLVQFATPGRAMPADSRSNDLWFQHLAIVVDDMQSAYAHLCSSRGWRPISAVGPQTLPASNGGVQAFKFRDPDGHPLELLWFPPGHGRAVWHEPDSSGDRELPFLGIDHSALAVSSTRASIAFYRALGMRPVERSLNVGTIQARLDDLPAARVKVTGLRPASHEGPGLELLAYRPAGRGAAFASVTDLSTDWITLTAISAAPPRHAGGVRTAARATGAPPAASDSMAVGGAVGSPLGTAVARVVGSAVGAAAAAAPAPRALTDPDGHRLVLIDSEPARLVGRRRDH
jgi:catechol 2,3-dioxygenase-like lactoylglutathione lyase family enzyme